LIGDAAARADIRLLAIQIESVRADASFEKRFDNWRRWCLQKGLHQGRVGSAEGNWRSPQIWHPPEPRPAAIDLPDAVAVNRAYTQLAIQSPSAAKAIQVIVFMPYLRPQRQAQILGTHYLRLDGLLDKTKIMLRNVLQGQKL
jgi:hypothetical protein